MKKLILTIAIAGAALSLKAQTIDDASTLIKTGNAAPAVSFTDATNKTTSLADYKGKLILLNFFATWCPPCRAELPRVQKEIWERYKDNPRFALLAFDREEGYDKLTPFKQSNNYTFTMLPDLGRNVYKQFATQYIPRNVLIDENGKVIYQSIGYSEKDFNELLNLLEAHLKSKS